MKFDPTKNKDYDESFSKIGKEEEKEENEEGDSDDK